MRRCKAEATASGLAPRQNRRLPPLYSNEFPITWVTGAAKRCLRAMARPPLCLVHPASLRLAARPPLCLAHPASLRLAARPRCASARPASLRLAARPPLCLAHSASLRLVARCASPAHFAPLHPATFRLHPTSAVRLALLHPMPPTSPTPRPPRRCAPFPGGTGPRGVALRARCVRVRSSARPAG